MKVQLISNELQIRDITLLYKVKQYILRLLVVTNLVMLSLVLYSSKEVKIQYVDKLVEKERYAIMISNNLKEVTRIGSDAVAKFCHNPGAIMMGSKKAVANSLAIGYVSTVNGNFLFFPSDKIGFQALQLLLKEEYAHMSVRDFIALYCPNRHNPQVNNEELYVANLCRGLGVQPSTRVGKVNQDKLCHLIAKYEGFY